MKLVEKNIKKAQKEKAEKEAQELSIKIRKEKLDQLRKLPEFHLLVEIIDKEIEYAKNIMNLPIGNSFDELGKALLTARMVVEHLQSIRAKFISD